ncbi:MAG: hypothetical protein WCQ63_04485, partial [Methanomethylophilus sp.]|nr:hypothetical protein [Methanomethylophilus sp.]
MSDFINENSFSTTSLARYERNARNREAAIALHETVCQICGFDFSKAYGERGRRFIEGHHRKPVSTFGGEL